MLFVVAKFRSERKSLEGLGKLFSENFKGRKIFRRKGKYSEGREKKGKIFRGKGKEREHSEGREKKGKIQREGKIFRGKEKEVGGRLDCGFTDDLLGKK
jgi:hypothetical protein